MSDGLNCDDVTFKPWVMSLELPYVQFNNIMMLGGFDCDYFD